MKYLIMLFILAFYSFTAIAQQNRGAQREQIEPYGVLYGLGIGVSQEIYKGYDYRIIPLPTIGYRSEKLRIFGPFISYDALNFSDVKLSIKAAPRFQGFDESDSYIFENMNKRKVSMDAGLGLSIEKNNYKADISTMFDVLGNSKGYESTADLSRVFRYGPVFFEPKISISYLDNNHVNYYYGVNADEVNAFTFAYQGKSTINTTLGFSISTPIFFDGFSSMSIEYTQFGSSITDSPLIEDDANLSARFLFSKFF
ncbi:MipA/OmpV family protein [Pseudoalteromonas sp. C2R02]|uniref:MipA/OmpV family protein n=1 Tax=Pseudoalteromonas sp. C2R02 TaxID=2841565 RepID=UPI001C084F1E|nr:MipA/OmpV family protein [Pseudoalteromonas sp. C2R02]MBU2972056.1 MipA/OmpV family protein [Pseudoalteromonas sp. C2R02]